MPDMQHALSTDEAETSTAAETEPTLLAVAGGLGGTELVDMLRQLFDLDDHLEPHLSVNFLRYIDRTSISRMVDFPPDPILPRAVLTLADYARTIHTVRKFLTDNQERFKIPQLVERRESTYMRDAGPLALTVLSVART